MDEAPRVNPEWLKQQAKAKLDEAVAALGSVRRLCERDAALAGTGIGSDILPRRAAAKISN